MADDNLAFPDPDEFPLNDDVDSDEAEAELPEDSFDEAVAEEHKDEELGCDHDG